MTQRIPFWRALAGLVGLFLVWQSVDLASSFASGHHAGAGGHIVLTGALIGVLLVLSWGAIRRRAPAGWIVLLGGILGSWSPMLASAAWATFDPANHAVWARDDLLVGMGRRGDPQRQCSSGAVARVGRGAAPLGVDPARRLTRACSRRAGLVQGSARAAPSDRAAKEA